MTRQPGLRILIANDAVAGPGALAPSLCANAANLLAQQQRRAMQRVAS
jgi:hypothetical protein